MNTEKDRREIQARINVARDLIDRVELVLVAEWKEQAGLRLTAYAARALDVAVDHLQQAVVSCLRLRDMLEREDADASRTQ
jgi:hypothetical protein